MAKIKFTRILEQVSGLFLSALAGFGTFALVSSLNHPLLKMLIVSGGLAMVGYSLWKAEKANKEFDYLLNELRKEYERIKYLQSEKLWVK